MPPPLLILETSRLLLCEVEVEVGGEDDEGVSVGEGKGLYINDSMEGVLVARSRVRRLCRMRRNRKRRRKRRMRSVKPRIYPIFDVDDRCCQNDWKSVFCVTAAMDIGDVLGRGGLGVAVGIVFRVDDVTKILCCEVEVKFDVKDIAIGS
jgi:hypothetical protein